MADTKPQIPVKDKVDPEKELETVTGENDNASVELYDGSSVQIYKCKLKHAAKVARAVNTVLMGLGVDSIEGASSINLDNPQTLLSTLDISSESLMDALEALTSLDRDAIDELDLDDALKLLGKVVEVNRDFFLKRVMSALNELMPNGEEKAPN
jgi:hypothetical protein